MNTDKPVMVSLKTLCQMYDWKYDTMWRKFKRGEFVQGYMVGRSIRFDLKTVDVWAHQTPINVIQPSLLRDVI